MSKIMDTNRKAHPDCKYYANPFHECGSDCLERIAQGGGKKNSKKQASKNFSLPGSFGKKKTESLPPSSLNTRHYQNGTANSPRAHQSSPSPVVAVKKTTTAQEANRSLPVYSDDKIRVDPNGQHDLFRDRGIPLSLNNTDDHVGKTVSPRRREHEHNGKNDTASEISVFNVVSPPRSFGNDDDDDDDDDENGVELDLESVMSESCVSVGKYRVNSAVSTILRSIIDKHGDIAENCKLESASMQSRYLECLCSLMQELGSTPVGQLTELKVKEMLAVLKDLESVNINIGWIRSVLEEFARYQKNTDSEKERQEGSVRAKKQELEIQEADLAQMEEEVVKAKLRIKEMKAELAELEKERSRVETMGFKVEKFKGKSFLDELL